MVVAKMRIKDGNGVQKKGILLFQFLEALQKLRQKLVFRYQDYPWAMRLSEMQDDPEHITIRYPGQVDGEAEYGEDTLLAVRNPVMKPCPSPGAGLRVWLKPGWDELETERPGVREERCTDRYGNELKVVDERFEYHRERFEDDPARVAFYHSWLEKRDQWMAVENRKKNTRRLFAALHSLFFTLENESDKFELIVANGILLDAENRDICHPLLTRRVKLEFDSEADIIFLKDTEASTNLYTEAFMEMGEDIRKDSIGSMTERMQEADYHPLDRDGLEPFLKTITNELSADGIYSEDGLPEGDGWIRQGGRLMICDEPLYIFRERMDGSLKNIREIISMAEDGWEFPPAISDIVEADSNPPVKEPEPEDIGERLAGIGGESVEILLSKEANREQLEIARRIETENAVLVQGPPGTGKTHTIANLMGHFLAQGKSLLVTSHTSKALKVLKDKLDPRLRNLCVTVLEDNNLDMERSVDGISDYMSRHTAFDLKKEVERLQPRREEISRKLADTRKKLFAMMHEEMNCITLDGNEYTPRDAALFVRKNKERLEHIIPGDVQPDAALPLSHDELVELYRSNDMVSQEEELELECALPDPGTLLEPEKYADMAAGLERCRRKLGGLLEESSWKIGLEPDEETILLKLPGGRHHIGYPEIGELEQLEESAETIQVEKPWLLAVVAAGRNGGVERERWETLVGQLEKADKLREQTLRDQFGLEISIRREGMPLTRRHVEELKHNLEDGGFLGKMKFMMNSGLKETKRRITINGMPVETPEQCDLVLRKLELEEEIDQCGRYWHDLVTVAGGPEFASLSETEPLTIAKRTVPEIERCLDWHENEYAGLTELLENMGIDAESLIAEDRMESDIRTLERLMDTVREEIPLFCSFCKTALEKNLLESTLRLYREPLREGADGGSDICCEMLDNLRWEDVKQEQLDCYSRAYSRLKKLYPKYSVLRSRETLLGKLAPDARLWAEQIRNREGIHGNNLPPESVAEAWKWKQLDRIIRDINSKPFRELQQESRKLSVEYRKITAEYAEKMGWYHLLSRTESDIALKQNLQGWKQTVKRIGKGTGKKAPRLRAIAREKMKECQSAVPAWIMPLNRAMETLSPRNNKFDVIIIDEASQSDISSLALLCMGEKVIIVGDDKQVSPTAVGQKEDKVRELEQMYIEHKIPNSHLYTGKTSIYDLAMTTYTPLMLREHFRCVPPIIGFSNSLSYDGKIKPLREAADSVLLPAVVSYRVDGRRDDVKKLNVVEARTIAALIKACIAEPEYEGKTFGVISMLGSDQGDLVREELLRVLGNRTFMERQIICGDSASLQGDERDVIFLSMVDSGDGEGPLRMKTFGADDLYRKRYNVAVSRARDQLWVVHSLDAKNDLKPGDIRRTLLDYAENPESRERKLAEIENLADSPFEVGVASALSARGYHLVQQWEVGAYRIDMVAVCGKKRIAIECDGERWHSGDDIRKDMERQTILERLGWRFIRIRGSEYFRDPDATIQRVVEDLERAGIHPEDTSGNDVPATEETGLLQRVKAGASAILTK